MSDLDHWSAPLGQAARQTLAADLVARLPPGKAIYPHLPKPDGALGVTVDVLDFKADGRGGLLQASWVVSGTAQASAAGAGPATRSGSATLHVDGPVADAAATARALSLLLGQLADQIVATL